MRCDKIMQPQDGMSVTAECETVKGYPLFAFGKLYLVLRKGFRDEDS